MHSPTIIIITGYSGSGKSSALAALEDAGFYCVDNMPVALLPKFLALVSETDPEIAGLGFVMDLREKGFIDNYPGIFNSLRKKGYQLNIIFLESDDQTLIQRYSQTRRQHPLAQGRSVPEGIRSERAQLLELRKAACQVINTSRFNVHELKSVIFEIAEKSRKTPTIAINILSFGFKYGIPSDADLVIDVRFLSNPYFVPELKVLTGESDKINEFVMRDPNTAVFLEKYLNLLDWLIPLYKKEGKAYLTIAIGCTGGQHRSVSVARAIFAHINHLEKLVRLTHRDINQ
ncbi:MAG: RNase adapter RapZ [Pseudomonadota bacterium]